MATEAIKSTQVLLTVDDTAIKKSPGGIDDVNRDTGLGRILSSISVDKQYLTAIGAGAEEQVNDLKDMIRSFDPEELKKFNQELGLDPTLSKIDLTGELEKNHMKPFVIRAFVLLTKLKSATPSDSVIKSAQILSGLSSITDPNELIDALEQIIPIANMTIPINFRILTNDKPDVIAAPLASRAEGNVRVQSNSKADLDLIQQSSIISKFGNADEMNSPQATFIQSLARYKIFGYDTDFNQAMFNNKMGIFTDKLDLLSQYEENYNKTEDPAANTYNKSLSVYQKQGVDNKKTQFILEALNSDIMTPIIKYTSDENLYQFAVAFQVYYTIRCNPDLSLKYRALLEEGSKIFDPLINLCKTQVEQFQDENYGLLFRPKSTIDYKCENADAQKSLLDQGLTENPIAQLVMTILDNKHPFITSYIKEDIKKRSMEYLLSSFAKSDLDAIRKNRQNKTLIKEARPLLSFAPAYQKLKQITDEKINDLKSGIPLSIEGTLITQEAYQAAFKLCETVDITGGITKDQYAAFYAYIKAGQLPQLQGMPNIKTTPSYKKGLIALIESVTIYLSGVKIVGESDIPRIGSLIDTLNKNKALLAGIGLSDDDKPKLDKINNEIENIKKYLLSITDGSKSPLIQELNKKINSL